jgi:hypothetical protein
MRNKNVWVVFGLEKRQRTSGHFGEAHSWIHSIHATRRGASAMAKTARKMTSGCVFWICPYELRP